MQPEDLVARGYYIFPCEGKRPLVKWRSASTRDLETISLWKRQFSNNGGPPCNWGIDCGKSNVAVIDVDSGKVPEAEDNLLDLLLEHGPLPPTAKSRTISNGYHLIHSGQIKNSASNKLGKGIDTRGMGGFIVAPGSIGYTLELDLPLTPIPDWVVDLVGRPSEHDKPEPDPNYIYDTDIAIRLAESFLKTAPPALMGTGGNDHIYRIAAHVKDFGVSCNTAIDMMLQENGWYSRCEPDNRPESLARIVNNAYEYGYQPAGASNPSNVFDVWIDPDAPAPRYKVLRSADLNSLPPLEWRVKGLITTRGLFQVYGPSMSGKSFMMLDMLAAIAEGRTWFGHRTKPCDVVLVCLEGEQGIRNRVAAWEKHNCRKLPDNFLIIAQPWSIITKKDIMDLSAVIPKGALIVIDTQNRAAPGINESASEDMGAVIEGAKVLERTVEGAVGLVAHTGKDASRGSRGHSSQLPAMDAAIEMTREGDIREWRAVKVKDGQDGQGGRFGLRVIELWEDEDGEMATSCVVDLDVNEGFDTGGFDLNDGEAAAWAAVKFMASESRTGEVTNKAWKAQLASQRGEKMDKKFGNKYYVARDGLIGKGLVRKENGMYVINALMPVESED